MQKLEPITQEELGEYGDALKRWEVYGLIRRCDLDASVLEAMRQRRAGISPEQIAYLRIRKSRRWSLEYGFPQMEWYWRAAFDFGPFKSSYTGKHDLDGGRLCDLCHTWIRFGHLLTHANWPHGHVIVGKTCALLLSDLDPDWAEKKLEEEFKLRRKKQAERLRLEALRLQRQRAEEEARLRKVLADQREAREIAAAMLRDYALRERGVPCRTLPLIPDQELVDAVVRPGGRQAWAERQRVIAKTLGATVSRALYVAGTGNCTFRAEVAGIPVSGTIFRRGSGWKAVINRPGVERPEYLAPIFPSWHTCRDGMVRYLVEVLTEYAATQHATKHYPWEKTSCRFSA